MCLFQDVVFAAAFHEAVSTKLNTLPNQLGVKYQDFLASIEPGTLQQLEEALKSHRSG